VLEQVVSWRGQPHAIRLDNGPELIADRFMTWCAERGIELSNPASQIKMPSSSDLIARIAPKC